MSLSWPGSKDPNDVSDWVLNWTLDDADEIDTVTWTVPAGLTKNSQSETASAATIWLSGGTAGETYSLLCRITTTGGRTFDQTVKLKCKER